MRHAHRVMTSLAIDSNGTPKTLQACSMDRKVIEIVMMEPTVMNGPWIRIPIMKPIIANAETLGVSLDLHVPFSLSHACIG